MKSYVVNINAASTYIQSWPSFEIIYIVVQNTVGSLHEATGLMH